MCNLDGFIAIPFDGFDNYLINQKGEVWSIKKGSYARVLIRSGYRAFYLCHRGSGKKKKKWLRACRGVAKAFIPNPENKPCVNHIDGNKLNDNIENLVKIVGMVGKIADSIPGLCVRQGLDAQKIV